MGRVLPDLPHVGLRQLVKYSYRVLYAFDEKGVTILAVVHGKRENAEEALNGEG
jgi:plasmid stabilization system protein ParE